VLELGFAGIHAELLRLAGFDVVVVEPDPAYLDRARERAGAALTAPPNARFDAAVVADGADLTGVRAARILVVTRDGAVARFNEADGGCLG
jgi:threonine dehydrogenase-like Zn-dependent dehydrogenase